MLLSSFVSAQENNAGEWVRVQSDNGEFSIEFPAASDFFRDNGGFYISRERESYRLTEMRMLNAFYEKTLLSFEIYKTDSPKAVADTIADRDEKSGKQSEVKIGEAKFKQVVLEKGNRYAVRRFYTSKDYVYILTAASRVRRNRYDETLSRFAPAESRQITNRTGASSKFGGEDRFVFRLKSLSAGD